MVLGNDGSATRKKGEKEQLTDSIKMHKAAGLTLPRNLIASQRSEQSVTRATKTEVCLFCASLKELCVCACAWRLRGLFLFSGLSLCQHITVQTKPNQWGSHSTDLPSGATPPATSASVHERYRSNLLLFLMCHKEYTCPNPLTSTLYTFNKVSKVHGKQDKNLNKIPPKKQQKLKHNKT